MNNPKPKLDYIFMLLCASNSSKLSCAIFALVMASYSLGKCVDIDSIHTSKNCTVSNCQCSYLVKGSDNRFLKRLTRFNFDSFETAEYRRSIEFLSDEKVFLLRMNPVIPWRNWALIRNYRGKFYAYFPCDFSSYLRQSVTDSSFVDWASEGPIASKIITQKIIDSSTFEFDLYGVYEQNTKLFIHIIDRSKGIAVFERLTSSGERKCYYMTPKEKLKNFELIANDCSDGRRSEFPFNDLSCAEILKK